MSHSHLEDFQEQQDQLQGRLPHGSHLFQYPLPLHAQKTSEL
jgi:hypothetical protein